MDRPRRSALAIVREYVGLAIVAVVLAFLIRTFLGLAFYIPSASMYPTLKVNDRVVVSRLSYRLHDPHRGDIIVFDNPNIVTKEPSLPVRTVRNMLEVVGIQHDKDKNLIKRLIGLPGDTLEGKAGHVYINGKLLIEPYLQPSVTTTDFGPLKIPKGRYWMMGDNRGNSEDSRYWTCPAERPQSEPIFCQTITESAMVGRAVVRVWPPWRGAFL